MPLLHLKKATKSRIICKLQKLSLWSDIQKPRLYLLETIHFSMVLTHKVFLKLSKLNKLEVQIYFLNTADHGGPRIERSIKDPAYLKKVNKITISLQRRNAGFASRTRIRKCQSNSGLFPCYWTSNSRQILDTISGTARLRHEKYLFSAWTLRHFAADHDN